MIDKETKRLFRLPWIVILVLFGTAVPVVSLFADTASGEWQKNDMGFTTKAQTHVTVGAARGDGVMRVYSTSNQVHEYTFVGDDWKASDFGDDSGSFLDDLAGVKNRVVITSADADSSAWSAEGWSFSKKLFHEIRLNRTLWEAFQAAEEMIIGNPRIFGKQRPELDDDGDGEYSSRDGASSSEIFIGRSGTAQSEPPIIKLIHPPITISADHASATLWVEASPSGEGIERVTALLIRPDFQSVQYDGESTGALDTRSIELGYNAVQDRYEAVYDDFRSAGTWKIMYEVEGVAGDRSDAKFGEVTAPGISIPVIVETWTN